MFALLASRPSIKQTEMLKETKRTGRPHYSQQLRFLLKSIYWIQSFPQHCKRLKSVCKTLKSHINKLIDKWTNRKKTTEKCIKKQKKECASLIFFFNIITPLGERMDRQKYGDERTGRQKRICVMKLYLHDS